MEGPPGQTEAVHGDGGNPVLLHLELDAGVNGPGLIFRHGKNRAGNHVFQGVLGDPDGFSRVDVRQVGVIVGRLGGNGERCITGPDGHLEALVHHHGHRSLRQAADDVAEEPGRQDALAGVGHVGGDQVADGRLHVIAGEAQAVSGPAENAFDGGKAALLCDGTARDIQAADQHTFFTGKAHIHSPCLSK